LEVVLGKPQISVVKRQREQAKRERALVKAAKKAQRKVDGEKSGESGPPIEADDFQFE
jgi:hypothetical protein